MRGRSTIVHALIEARRSAFVEMVHKSLHCRDIDLGTGVGDVGLDRERDSIDNGTGSVGVSRTSRGRSLRGKDHGGIPGSDGCRG